MYWKINYKPGGKNKNKMIWMGRGGDGERKEKKKKKEKQVISQYQLRHNIINESGL